MRIFRIVLPVLVLGALITGGCTSPASPTATKTITHTTVLNAGLDSLPGLETTLENIYSSVNPSVVNIMVTLSTGGAQASGFVWDDQGNIVTNNHVVSGATGMTVTFSDGTTVNATLVGTDPDSDLAVIKVKPGTMLLQPVSMGDSTVVKVGQLAIAIGNPFGLEGTMTVGFVSAVGRILPANQSSTLPGYSIPDIIQTDTALNPGNSGGVLLDSSANVIGVTQSIDTSSGTSSGVGFAIPASIVEKVVPALVKTGHYDHPYLGLSVVSLSSDIATAMNLPAGQRGALVQQITAGGPADKSGLTAGSSTMTINGQQLSIGGDVIIAFNGGAIKSSDELVTQLSRSSPGDKITLTVLRGGKQIDIQATIGVRPVQT